jgi:hypothetical protein
MAAVAEFERSAQTVAGSVERHVVTGDLGYFMLVRAVRPMLCASSR